MNSEPMGIVTGAASGIGKAAALRFAREGFRVAAVDRDEAGLRRLERSMYGAKMGLVHGPLSRMIALNGKETMKSLRLDLPDKLAEELTKLVRDGWFRSEDELVRTALSEFLRSHPLELTERFQREDIAWALREKENPK